MRYRLRKLFLAAAVVAVVCGLYVAARSLYYLQRREASAILSKVHGISDVELQPYDDIVEEVNNIRFTVDGEANSVVNLAGLSSYQDNGCFLLGRIGELQFRTSGRHYGGAYDAISGEPVESGYLGFHIALGTGSPYKNLIPFEVNTIQDLVDHYAELVEVFKTWPREGKPGSVMLEDGSIQYYYVVLDSE